MKCCPQCQVVMPAASFSRAKTNRDGRKNTCTLCVMANWRVWYGKNKKAFIARVSEWKKAHPGKVAVTNAKSRKRHPMACRAAWQRWAARYPEKVKAKNARYHREHRQWLLKRKKAWRQKQAQKQGVAHEPR